MKQLLLALLVSFSISSTFSQDLKTYKGVYDTRFGIDGEITYQYYEDAEYERVYQGTVSYINNKKQIQLRGICTMKADGFFDQNLKSGKWVYEISDNNGRTKEFVKGSYDMGKMNGPWTLTSKDLKTGKSIKESSVNFINNRLTGAFSFKYQAYQFASDFFAIDISGVFNDDGFYDGEWKVNYTEIDKVDYEMIHRYKEGVLYWSLKRNKATGEVIHRFDNKEFTDLFFESFSKETNRSVIDGDIYVLVPKEINPPLSSEHPIYCTFKYWTLAYTGYFSYDINGKHPARMIERGDLMIEDEYLPVLAIVKWEETEEGRMAIAIEKEYSSAIEKADSYFAQENYSQAIEYYQKAIEIQITEYAQEKLKESALLKEHQEKKAHALQQEQLYFANQLAAIKVNNTRLNNSYRTVNKLLSEATGETIYTIKKKHLFNAYVLLYDSFMATPTRHDSRKDVEIILNVQERVTQLEDENTRSLEKALKGINEESEILSLLEVK